MERSSPDSLGLTTVRSGAGRQRKASAPGGQRSPETGRPTAAGEAAKPASAPPEAGTGGSRWPWQRRQQQAAPPWRVEGLRRQQKHGDDSGGSGSWFWRMLIGLLILNWILSSALLGAASSATVSYSFFLRQVNASNVQQVTSTGNTIQGTFKHEVGYPAGKNAQHVAEFTTERPAYAGDHLFQRLQAHGVTVTAKPPDQSTPLWEQLLLWFGPALLLGGLLAWWWRRGGGTAGLARFGGMGRSKARRYDPGSAQRTTFADVAGIDEVKDQVWEIADFLRNPDRYRKLGARIPRGVLLSGQPGTGKTLLARAVAGEADVPFFSISASEFVEMIVGVGASRVRDLFDQAKQVAPAIIFIDELDAIGRARGGSSSVGSSDEQEQTLNQILTEMDGFTGEEGVVVLAATNRPDVLDAALLRPGRFDRRVTISAPDLAGRRQILAVHARGVPLADGVDVAALAAATPGMVGADLANLVNEAALLAARRGHDKVTMADFSDSLEKIYLGTARGIVLSPQERERTAFHESGHAPLGMLTPGADPVRKISIIPRGQALGVTYQAPEADRYGYSEAYLRGRITGALGGRAAEEVVYGDITTGAENDLEHASEIARQMAGRWGMSPAIGPVSVLPSSSRQSPYGFDGVAPGTRELVDTEARRIIEDCYQQALTTLRSHRDQLSQLAHALLERETLDENDAYAAAGVDCSTAPAAITRGEAAGTTSAPDAPVAPGPRAAVG